jgi:hypothetical protein
VFNCRSTLYVHRMSRKLCNIHTACCKSFSRSDVGGARQGSKYFRLLDIYMRHVWRPVISHAPRSATALARVCEHTTAPVRFSGEAYLAFAPAPVSLSLSRYRYPVVKYLGRVSPFHPELDVLLSLCCMVMTVPPMPCGVGGRGS